MESRSCADPVSSNLHVRFGYAHTSYTSAAAGRVSALRELYLHSKSNRVAVKTTIKSPVAVAVTITITPRIAGILGKRGRARSDPRVVNPFLTKKEKTHLRTCAAQPVGREMTRAYTIVL